MTTNFKQDNPGCDCCCSCASGYADITGLWSQIDATVTGPVAMTPSTEFLAAANGVICGDGLTYAYNPATHTAFAPNRIQYSGPSDCSSDIYGQADYGLFVFLPYDGSGAVALGPLCSYSVSAICIGGVLHYCWEAVLSYRVAASSAQFNNPDCHGVQWRLPLYPGGGDPNNGASYTSTTGDETTVVTCTLWATGTGLAGGSRYVPLIVVTKQGCSTNIGDIPTSFTLAPAYNPAGFSVQFDLS